MENRVIKFRGKSKRTNEWVYGAYFLSRDGEESYIKTNDFTVVEDIEVYERSVGQFTGRQDEYNEDLFDGDAVEVHYNDDMFSGDAQGVIEWHEDGYWAINFSSFGFKTAIFNDKIEDIKRIGNIYEHPNLLK